MSTAPSRPRSRRIADLVPDIVHSCYFALVWSTHRLRRHVADRIFIVLFLRHGNHSERYNRRQQQNLFPRLESLLVIRRLREVRRLFCCGGSWRSSWHFGKRRDVPVLLQATSAIGARLCSFLSP